MCLKTEHTKVQISDIYLVSHFYEFIKTLIFFLSCSIIVVQSEENPDKDTLNRSSTLTPSSANSNTGDNEVSGMDLYILAGHEAMQL